MPHDLNDVVLQHIRGSTHPLDSSDLCRILKIKGDDRRDVRMALKQLEETGQIIKLPGQKYTLPKGLPSVITAIITQVTMDGETLATPVDWPLDQGKPPRIIVAPGRTGHPPLKEGDRAVLRLKRHSDHRYDGDILKMVDGTTGRILGEVQRGRGADRVVRAINKKSRSKDTFDLAATDGGSACDIGDLVIAELLPARGLQRAKVRVIDRLGHRDDPRLLTLIAAHEKGVRDHFPDAVLRETEGLTVPPLGGRADLRSVPLVTIDGEDARDFDDAVYAESDSKGGHHLIVAIADVAHYVGAGSALDREAYRRGNSTYFPDRVMPMLPESLSNDLCSLRPREDRACLAVHLWIDAGGQLTHFEFVRGLMRSVARLTYTQVQSAMDDNPTPATDGLLDPVIKPLYDAYRVLDQARIKRGSLDLDIPERKIILDARGVMTGVMPRERLDSHKLIEEFMVLANVAAARALTQHRAPCLFRIHDRPSLEKILSARDFLASFDLNLPKTGITKPDQLNHLLQLASDKPFKHLIHETLLRTQAQAVYHPDNIGHFGLALTHYAHFTSPIRRYADLFVHRSLISALKLGDGGMAEDDAVRAEEIAQHISSTERASAEAERNAIDRFCARFLMDHMGTPLAGTVSGVTRFGLFVKLKESGADGLIPIRTLPNDYYHHDERQHALIGRRTGLVFRLGDPVSVIVIEADPITGSCVLELVEGAPTSGKKPLHPLKNMSKENRHSQKNKKPSGKPPRHGQRRPKKRS